MKRPTVGATSNGHARCASEDPVAGREAPRTRRGSRRRTSSAVVALAVLGFATATASAGEYQIDFCKNWSTDAPAAQLPYTSSYVGGVNNDCRRGGASGGLHALSAGGMMPFDSNAAINLQVPPDLAGITIKRVLTQYSSPASGGSLAFVRLWAAGSLLDNNVTPQARYADHLLPNGARDLAWSIYCSYSAGPTPCYFPASDDVHHVYKARLFLSESVDPSLVATGGSLLSGGPNTGPRTLVLDAVDGDSGVSGLTVKLDGTIVADVSYPCAFDGWSACRRDRRDQVVDIDTTKVPDGPRALTVAARDAAGNETRRVLGDVRIMNSVPVATVPVATVPVKRGPALIRLHRSRLTVPNGRSAVIGGRLVDDDDRPIARANIQIDERSYVPKTGLIGPGWAPLGQVVSDESGAFTAKIPPGASRALRFSFAPAGVAAAAEARVSVRAGVTLRASRRVVRNGSAVRFMGRVAGAVPRAGVIVTLQAYVPGRGWVPTDSRPKVARAGANGRFSVGYQFRNTVRRTRYRFRVLVNEDSGFAYARAPSRSVAVTVLPRR